MYRPLFRITTARLLLPRIARPAYKRRYSTRHAIHQAAGTTGNILIISSVMGMFGYIVYTLYDNLLAEHGTTRIYNESLDLIRSNPQIRQLFGNQRLKGFGEPTRSQRQRHRPISHHEYMDPQGRHRLGMHYYIENSGEILGVAKVDMSRSPLTQHWDYNYVVVDVYGSEDMDRKLERVEVLMTDEFSRELKEFETSRRNQKFSTKRQNAGNESGSWFGVLHPGNWKK